MHVMRIAGKNINGLRNETQVGMLRAFVMTHDLYVVLVQEVTPRRVWTFQDIEHTPTLELKCEEPPSLQGRTSF